jgi:aerobic-type carbon monoxide dehydrogenase small subunit (CoxS/CutS family)
MEIDVKLRVNGVLKTVMTSPERKLLEVLREDLQLTGPKYGCGEGQCRACIVLLDGEPAMSCLLPVKAVEGKSITTIEGLASGDTLHPVQQAFLEEGAMQCGYCTGGMIISAVALLRKTPDPSDEEIVRGMNGNLCRCNGYVKITAAVRNAAQKLKEQNHGR